MPDIISVPTVSGLKGAATDYVVGLGGGLLTAFATQITGSGLIGGAVAAAFAGSIVKGERGTIIATIAGYNAVQTGALTGGGDGNSGGLEDDDVM